MNNEVNRIPEYVFEDTASAIVNEREKALTEEERENLLSLLPLNCSKCDAYLLELKQIGSLKIKIDGKGGGTVMAHCFECLVKELETKVR